MSTSKALLRLPNQGSKKVPKWVWWAGGAALLGGGYLYYRSKACPTPKLSGKWNWLMFSHPDTLSREELGKMQSGDKAKAVLYKSYKGGEWTKNLAVIDPDFPLYVVPVKLFRKSNSVGFTLDCVPKPPWNRDIPRYLEWVQENSFEVLHEQLLPPDFEGKIDLSNAFLGGGDVDRETVRVYIEKLGSVATPEKVANKAYAKLLPDCPKKLDPGNSKHKPCMDAWKALRDLAKHYM